MERRDFCKLMAAATALPLAAKHSRAAEAGPGADTSYPETDWASLVQGRNFEASGGKVLPGTWNGVPLESPFPGLAGDGPYRANWDSMLQYDAPEWYRDAKFGIWAHWSPQCVAESGDWYARFMYIEGNPRYKFQCDHYGHPSKFGYKDLCAQWTLLNWDPDALIARYKNAGARIFFALANHHDGFDAWNSRHQPWNAQNIGPHRDVVGDWAAAARRQGLRFGVSVHAARNWWWMRGARLCDRDGPLAGVPYDGHLTLADGRGQWWEGYDPTLLYGRKHGLHEEPDALYVRNFYDRIRDLIDLHDPDVLYFDDALLPLGWGGMNLGAYFYNHNLQTRGGKMEAVLNIKVVPNSPADLPPLARFGDTAVLRVSDSLAKAVVADYERGVTNQIMPYAWQSETCIGDWHYDRQLYRDHGYMKPGQAIHWLADTVSKNGTFILDVPGRPDGTIDDDEIAVLDGITGWMRLNSEAIYATRPWKVFGEGEHLRPGNAPGRRGVAPLDARDIRFTRNKANTVIYAIFLGWPEDGFTVRALGGAAETHPDKIAHVQLLGTDEPLIWQQTDAGLRVEPPRYRPPNDYAATLKVTLA